MNFAGGGYQSVGDTYGGGGGYMVNNNTGGFGSPSVSQSPGIDGRKKVPKNQSIRPITSAMLQSAIPPTGGEEAFTIDGEDIGQIVLVGEIIEVVEMATNIVYKVDDRTGPLIEIRRWVDDNESSLELQRRAACREGIYIKVVGHIRAFNNQLNVVGFYIRPIEDFSEVTHHLVETIYTHLAITKGLTLPKEFSTMQGSAAGSGPGGWNPGATSTQVGATYGGGMINSGLDAVQKQVLSIINQGGSDQGMHMKDIGMLARKSGHSEMNIKRAIDFLSNEGHIYSTIDDEHYKSTEEI